MTRLNRRLFCGAALASLGAPALAEPEHDITALQDFDELWRTLDERYGFFAEKATDWKAVRRLYRPMAAIADTIPDYAEVLRQVLCELYDPHTRLSEPPDGSPRFPPFDLWTEWRGGKAMILDIQPDSGAAAAGLLPGFEIVAVDGTPIKNAAQAALPRCLSRPDPAADLWALQSAAAGRRGHDRTLEVIEPDGYRGSRLIGKPGTPPPADAITWSRFDGGLPCIRISTFGDPAAVAQFDAALAALKDAPGLILDLRSNGGGDTAIGKPMMGRFIAEPKVYATMRRREGAGLSEPWAERVEPRGPFTWTKPVVVLIDHWSASMAEGFPMGMRAVCGARLVGTPMQGLGAAVFPLRLDRTGIQAQYSGEPVYTPAGEPRWRLQPDVTVRSRRADGQEILEAGVTELKRLVSRSH
jgi:carboxyl-terminal processing protease